jgi:hypothetical protein
VVDLHLHAHLPGDRLHHLRQFQHRKLLGELIEDPALARLGRMKARQLDAAHRVANIQEAARLSALAIDRQRIPIAAWAQKRFSTVPKTSS